MVPVHDAGGRVARWFGTYTDITAQQETEQRLQLQTERLRLLWEAAAVLLSTDEPDAMLRGVFEKISPHFDLDVYFNFMVREGEDVLELASYSGIQPEEASKINVLRFGQAVCGAVAQGKQSIVATSIQQSDDPRVQLVKGFGVRCYACNPLLADGQLLGTLSFASRTRDEFDSEELDVLRTISKYATAAYERLRLIEQLRDSDRRKDEFLATLGHELRNPLAPVRTAVQLMRTPGAAQRDLDWARDVIDRQVEHLARLIDDLLDVGRITHNKLDLRRQRVSLAQVVEAAVESSRSLITARHQLLEVQLPPNPIWLDADATRLTQILLNLLNNSAKYTPQGGKIWLAAQDLGANLVVSVKDTGVGIPAARLPKIFDMFAQFDTGVSEPSDGLALGCVCPSGWRNARRPHRSVQRWAGNR